MNPDTPHCPNCTNGIVRSLGRDNDLIEEDCPFCCPEAVPANPGHFEGAGGSDLPPTETSGLKAKERAAEERAAMDLAAFNNPYPKESPPKKFYDVTVINLQDELEKARARIAELEAIIFGPV
jgi:hypothetical protein